MNKPAHRQPASPATESAADEGPDKKGSSASDARDGAGPLPTAAAWARVLKQLRTELGEDVFASWFGSVEFDRGDRAIVQLSVPTRFLKLWIHSHYRDRLHELWRLESSGIRRVDLVVRSAVRPKGETPAPVGQRPAEPTAPAAPAPAKPTATRQRPAPQPGPLGGSPVDPRCTFASFCEGQVNRMALAAARTIADGSTQSALNPLFIHAGVGRGKSHLLHAVTQAARDAQPSRSIVYLTAEHFMYRFVSAVRSHSGVAFKDSLQEIDILLIDDVQFLQGKATQQEFAHLLTVLIDGARQVVVAADRPPTELDSLDERVRSRLGGGVAFEIGAPDLDLRRRILASRYEVARSTMPALEITPAVLDFVAQTVATNGRDLEGALNRLIAQWQFTNAPITIPSAEVTLRDLIGIREPRRVRVEDIQRVVTKHFNISKTDLLSARRTQVIVRPRQIGMYLAKVMTPQSLPEIGRRFGKRDHTTVLHAVRKIEALLAVDKALADEIELLKRMVEDLPSF